MRRGFTLLELLVVMAIMALLMSATVAGYFAIGQGGRMRGAINTLSSNLALARQRAILKQEAVRVSFTNDVNGEWHYTVSLSDGQRMGDEMHIPPGVGLDFGGSDQTLTFTPAGNGGFDTVTFDVKDLQGKETWEMTVYGLTGLVRAEDVTP